jgi:hypothetical protein
MTRFERHGYRLAATDRAEKIKREFPHGQIQQAAFCLLASDSFTLLFSISLKKHFSISICFFLSILPVQFTPSWLHSSFIAQEC